MPDNSGTGNPALANDEIMEMLVRVFNKAASIEREPVDTGDGILLFTSEIHLIDTVGRFPGTSMSALATKLGITKGALSQTAKKLEEKGFLERTKPDGNNKTVFLSLTPSGTNAFAWHDAYHAAVREMISGELSVQNKSDRAAVREFLVHLEKIFDECPEIRRRVSKSSISGRRT